jgi:hypothetical protein
MQVRRSAVADGDGDVFRGWISREMELAAFSIVGRFGVILRNKARVCESTGAAPTGTGAAVAVGADSAVEIHSTRGPAHRDEAAMNGAQLLIAG